MAYGVKYRFEWYNQLNKKCKIDFEFDGYASSITTLEHVGPNPVTVRWNGDEYNKFTPICASEASITLIRTTSFDIDDLTANTDFNIKVKVYYQDSLYWVGWLMQDDLQEPFTDDNDYLQLKAVDGLSFLKNIELRDKSGNKVWGAVKPITYLDYCLYYTNLNLSINTWANIYPSTGTYNRGTTPGDEPFNLCTIYSWAFLTGKSSYDKCYSVLEKILKGFGCRLFQYAGEWHIVRTEDYLFGNLAGSKFTSGAYASSETSKNFTAYVGKDRDVKYINADHIRGIKRNIKYSKLVFPFNNPQALLNNQAFLDGTFNAPLSSATRSVYTLDGWTYTGSTTYNTVYIGKELDSQGNEQDRYAFIYSDNNAGTTTTFTSSAFPCRSGDRMVFSYSYKNRDFSVSFKKQQNQVKLVSGSTTYYLRNDGIWTTTVSYVGEQSIWGNTKWRTFTLETDYFPADGLITIIFSNSGFPEGPTNEARFKDVQIDYIGYAYDIVRSGGQYDKLTQTESSANNIEDQVDISHCIVPVYKGAIFNSAGSALLENWTHSGLSETLQFLRVNNLSYFRTNYRYNEKLEGSFRNIGWYNSSNVYQAPLGMINNISFDEITDKTFLITRLEQDLDTEISKISLIEITKASSGDNTEGADTQENGFLDVDEDSVRFKSVKLFGFVYALFKYDNVK